MRPHAADARSGGLAGLLIVAALLGGVAACGGGSKKASGRPAPIQFTPRTGPVPTSPGGADSNRECAVVTQGDVESAIGASVKPGQGIGGLGCRYELKASPEQFVSVATSTAPNNAGVFDQIRTRTGGVSGETLTGVGDKAFVAGGQAYVLKGTRITTINVSVDQPLPMVVQAAKKLAQAAARRL